jgi:hypothetical protein
MAKADSVHSTPPENTSSLSPDNPPSLAAGSGLVMRFQSSNHIAALETT